MITAVDTNVLLDVFADDPGFASRSKEWLRAAYDRGAILACDIVYAELAPAFPDRASLDHALGMLGATVSPITTDMRTMRGDDGSGTGARGAPENASSRIFSSGRMR